MSVNDPDVVLTDLGLALLGTYLGWRMWTAGGPAPHRTASVIVMLGLASAALFGAAFHAFFPANTATRAGFIAWIPVALSILLVAATLLALSLQILAPRLPPAIRSAALVAYVVAFSAVVLLIDESFTTIVRFYAPALALFLITSVVQAIRYRSAGWTLIAISFTISALAATLQQARVAIHPVYFDHNALYHVLQGIALLLLYLGFRRMSDATTGLHARGTDPAPR
jgi:hypothetical protein